MAIAKLFNILLMLIGIIMCSATFWYITSCDTAQTKANDTKHMFSQYEEKNMPLIQDSSERSFTVDDEKNTFLMDGKPFRYISGSFHYFRALPKSWKTRLQTMRMAGLNAIDTYVEWALHNPYDGVYNWDGIANIEKFIELAHDEKFFVILRPGPYICAERDNGGLPFWLFAKYPNIQLRTNDSNYINEVSIWYSKLFPRIQKYLYGNGGPIIMVQIENEYGVYHACDKNYLNWLRDETKKYTEQKTLLFTTDIPNERIKCGKIDGVFATTDFGIDKIDQIDKIWDTLRSVQPTGPLVNSEFYPGWLTHWQESNQRRNAYKVAEALRIILEHGASVNFYMFFGGTNFGFTAGANDWGFGNYTPDITSYDYDAVLDEAGGITEKFELVREVIQEYLNTSTNPSCVHSSNPPISYGMVQMQPVVTLLSDMGRLILSKGAPIQARKPKSFEELNQHSGLVLYETELPNLEIDPTLLTVNGLRDRAFVFVNEQLVGTLSRENAIFSIPLHKGWGNLLQLIVENQGRINFNLANDTKGIFGDVSIQNANGEKQVLNNWNSTSFPLHGNQIEQLETLIGKGSFNEINHNINMKILMQGPVVYYGEFFVSKFGDSYLNTSGWGKGVAYVNGFNLGRYWPLAGPQITLYLPQEILHIGINTIILLEFQRVNILSNQSMPSISLDIKAQLDGKLKM